MRKRWLVEASMAMVAIVLCPVSVQAQEAEAASEPEEQVAPAGEGVREEVTVRYPIPDTRYPYLPSRRSRSSYLR
jgi:hypothetical protein